MCGDFDSEKEQRLQVILAVTTTPVLVPTNPKALAWFESLTPQPQFQQTLFRRVRVCDEKGDILSLILPKAQGPAGGGCR